LADVHVDRGVERVQLPLVHGQIGVGKVAEEDGFGAVAGELVCAGAADADGGVCACK
jgi:hypothetical protein